MNSQNILGALVIAATLVSANSAHALTTQECSSKYKTERAANALKGMKWGESRKSVCGLSGPATTSGQATMPGERPASSLSSWGAPSPAGSPQ